MQTLEADKKTNEEKITALKEEVKLKVTEGKHNLDEVIANRNHWKQKAESLRTHLNVLLPKVGGSKIAKEAKAEALAQQAKEAGANSGSGDGHAAVSDVSVAEKAEMTKKIEELTKQNEKMAAEVKASNSAIEAYKKAFEAQLLKLKMEREANLVLTQNAHAGQSGMQQQYIQLRNLANSLSETISDKDVALSHMRQANKILGARVRELEERFRIELTMEEDDSLYTPARRNLLMDEKALGMSPESESPTPKHGSSNALGTPTTAGSNNAMHSRRESKDHGGSLNIPQSPMALTPNTPSGANLPLFSNASLTSVGHSPALHGVVRKESIDTDRSKQLGPAALALTASATGTGQTGQTATGSGQKKN